ncbi:MAG: hypothetical protein ABIJ97_13625 [Bacteroidota bacterium]
MKRINVVFWMIILFGAYSLQGYSQNIAITDDDAYTANSSAMLDVKSLTKGLLIPRLTTAQRTAIVTPATGLLVFDTSINGFYYYNGSTWINLTSGSSGGLFWSYTSPNIYMTTGTNKLGLGTSSPLHKLHLYESVAITDGTDGNFIDIQNSNNTTGVMSGIRFQNGTTVNTFKGGIFYRDNLANGRGNLIFANNTVNSATNVSDNDARLVLQSDGRVMVKGDPNQGVNAAIFAVQNSAGDTVFAVYPEGVRVWVNDAGGSKATGSRGGFAVGGFSPSKAGFTNEFLRVTPDSVRVYIDDDFVGSKATGNRGGFAVGGFSPSKGSMTDNYFFVQDDSTRVYVNDSTAGFGVSNIEGLSNQSIMKLTTENYFIGHESGINATPGVPTSTSGKYNSTMGYNTARSLTTGKNNIFFGYKSGYLTTSGTSNTFIGYLSGYTNTAGVCNIFIGERAGYLNDGYYGTPSVGSFNTYLGYYAGHNLVTGLNNVMIGNRAGWNKTAGDHNVMIGSSAGANNSTGSRNIFIGYQAATNETGSDKLYIENSTSSTPLIYGDFASDYLRIYGKIGINTTPTYMVHIVDNTTSSDAPAIRGEHMVTEGYGVGVYGEGNWRGVQGNVTSNYAGTIYGVYGYANNTGTGSAYAGYFSGNVNVTGTLSKGGGSFKIDHPLDPENKYLYHSFVESPDMKNIYDGVIILDNNGEAVVNLPDWFEALNDEFRYQLTPIGGAAPNIHISQEVSANQFKISGGNPGMKVSWMVTGIRIDPFAVKNRIPVEVEKDNADKGYYLYPDVYKLTKEKGIDYKNNELK